jgi:hypothetical protein
MINRFKNPGVYLALMWWWIIAFFVIHLIVHPLPAYFSSYIRYFGAFLVIGASGITIGLLNAKINFWSRFGHWRRFLVLIGAYTLSVFLVLGSSVGMINYMSADFWGTSSRDSDFEMACLPTAIFYFIIGILWSVIFSIINLIKKKRTR